MITIPLHTTTWNVVQPAVFRYLEQRHIDAFFDTGEIRLSSFQRFAKHEDEERLDMSEGIATLQVGGEGGFLQSQFQLESGYVLSGSMVEDEGLMHAFNVDGYFRIDNTVGFAAAIGRRLPHFRGGLEGPCRYEDVKILDKQEDGVIDTLMTADGKIKADVLGRWAHEVGNPAIFFLKLKQYRKQAEYRFMWNVHGDVEATIDLRCPDARQYCTRITR